MGHLFSGPKPEQPLLFVKAADLSTINIWNISATGCVAWLMKFPLKCGNWVQDDQHPAMICPC